VSKQGWELHRIAGDAYEMGRQLGELARPGFDEYMEQSAAWHAVRVWRGHAFVRHLRDAARAHCPAQLAELDGMAAGLGWPADDVFLWNCRGDVWASAPDGCTTVQLPAADCSRISHNEDGDPGFAGHCAIAQCHIDGSPGFAAFVYPGSLPGHTFAVTDAGLVITVNNLRQREVQAGVPRMVLTRAVLDARDPDAAVAVLRDHPRAGGFHLTLAHRASAALLSIEYSSHACSVQEVTQPSLHANHAIHPAMRGFAQIVTDSSRDRQARGDALHLAAGHAAVKILRESRLHGTAAAHCASSPRERSSSLAVCAALPEPA